MEKILSIKDLDPKGEKYASRKLFADYFSDRGCLFFVRPLNDERKIRKIDQ